MQCDYAEETHSCDVREMTSVISLFIFARAAFLDVSNTSP